MMIGGYVEPLVKTPGGVCDEIREGFVEWVNWVVNIKSIGN